jgi:hypothetical protein
MIHSRPKVHRATWFGPPQVSAAITSVIAMIASSCQRIACTASLKRVGPWPGALHASLRGPVSQPVRNASSCQPQASTAQVNAA